mmetsp:Transcript_7278/g.24451  ORF Transcript_7278/g.24451 Transcript_7278/m.24451 type:complete len:226 (+) Transcript_7278:113-790(+)
MPKYALNGSTPRMSSLVLALAMMKSNIHARRRTERSWLSLSASRDASSAARATARTRDAVAARSTSTTSSRTRMDAARSRFITRARACNLSTLHIPDRTRESDAIAPSGSPKLVDADLTAFAVDDFGCVVIVRARFVRGAVGADDIKGPCSAICVTGTGTDAALVDGSPPARVAVVVSGLGSTSPDASSIPTRLRAFTSGVRGRDGSFAFAFAARSMPYKCSMNA